MTLRRAIAHHVAGTWPAAEAGDRVTLDYDSRHRRRFRMTTEGGVEVLLDLAKAVAMADGDGLRLEDGGWLAVAAALEPVVEVTCAGARHLARIAWHLGNRHLPAQFGDRGILIRPDHVIEEMLRGLGAETRRLAAPFQPEGGAYAAHRHLPHEAADGH